MNTYRTPLRVIQTSRASGELKRKLLDEEVFECLRKNIENSPGPIGKNQKNIEKTALNRKERKDRREKARKELVELFGKDIFTRFKTRRKRTEFARVNQLTHDQVCELKRMANRIQSVEKRRRKKKTTRSTYDAYISSKQWEARRNLYWQTHPKRCAICGTYKFIHLHHMSYRKLKREPDEHLVALCSEHHAQFHLEHGTQRDMIAKTTLFIERNQLF